jgi:hypothetical protein
MARRLGPSIFCALLLAGSAGGGAAQRLDELRATAVWPVSWSAERLRPTSLQAGPLQPPGAPQARERLPVYDDAGEVIPYELIQARLDSSGAGGAILGGLLMTAAGALAGALLTAYDCNEERAGYYYECSPRENAMRSALTGGLAATGAVVGVWWGWNSDKTTWDEALREIREERARGSR